MRWLVVVVLTLVALITRPTLPTTASGALTFPSSPISARTANAPLTTVPTAPAALAPSGRLILAAESSGAWNLFAVDPNGGAWQPLSNMAPARDPALSPDGKMVAFRSHRDGFWEIYSMPVNGSTPARLTRGTLYSGAPAWSPDGQKIAFESYTRGDLDIWVMNADGTLPVDLTADDKYQDYGPAWSPDGKWIAFTSWRTGTQQIMLISASCTANCTAMNLSQNRFDDQQPEWSPDGRKMAFVSDRDGQRAIYTADLASSGLQNIKRVTFSGWDEQPAWSPDGQWIAFVSVRPTRQPVYIVSADGGVPRLLDDGPMFATSVTWAPDASPLAAVKDAVSPNSASGPSETLQPTGGETPRTTGSNASEAESTLYETHPDLAAPGSGHPFELRRITSTKLDPGVNKLNGRVADSFVALQTRLKQEVGYDFLNTLADMARPLSLLCDITCDTLSWHKAGRAFDSRLDYTDARGSALEVVREDEQGETFWRLFLRTSAQDGSMGEPMKEAPWDMSYRARWVVGRGEGGIKKPVPSGFYVDFTELAREYGWDRISSHDDEGFDWRTDKIAAEYWHYQRLQGLNWYDAIREVYSETDLRSLVEWNALVTKSGYDPYLLYLKGIPAPAKSWRWNVLGP